MRKKILLFLNIFFIALAGLEHSFEPYIKNPYLNPLCFYLFNIIFLLGISLWFFTIRYRILDKNISKGFFSISVWLFLLIVDKVLKYRIVENMVAVRYLDYLYYVMIGFAVTEFLVLTSYLAKPVGYKPSWHVYLVYIIPALISLMIMTNELHHLNYTLADDGSNKFAWGQFIVMGAFGAELAASFIIILKKCFIPSFRDKIYIPILCFLFTVAGYLLGYVLPDVRFPFNFPDFTVIAIITFIESFIYTGLIRSNENYRELFRNSGFNAFITDTELRTVYRSMNSSSYSPLELKEALSGGFVKNDIRLNCEDLGNALFFYEESLKKINDMNRRLSDVLVSVDEENEMLEEEQKVQKERLRLLEEMDLLSEITYIIRPSVDRMNSILKDLGENDPDYGKKVSEACFIISYIKRRINLTLLHHMGRMSNAEMEFALHEMMSFYKLTGTDVSYILDPQRSIDDILDSFDYCYKILSDHLGMLEACFITFGRDKLRITMDSEDKTLIYTYPGTEGEEA